MKPISVNMKSDWKKSHFHFLFHLWMFVHPIEKPYYCVVLQTAMKIAAQSEVLEWEAAS